MPKSERSAGQKRTRGSVSASTGVEKATSMRATKEVRGASRRTAEASTPMIVATPGERLAHDLRRGRPHRRMTRRRKVSLLKRAVTDYDVYEGPWDYAYLTSRAPWIEDVARLAVLDASLRTNPNDFLMSASDGTYHTPYAGAYFRAPKANVPVLVSFLANALKAQTVTLQAGGKLQKTAIGPGWHHLAIVVVPQDANHYGVSLTTQRGDPKKGLLELAAVELTTLK
jgi:hypothetical protein